MVHKPSKNHQHRFKKIERNKSNKHFKTPAQELFLEKDTGFARGISDATTAPGSDLPEIEDLENYQAPNVCRQRQRTEKK